MRCWFILLISFFLLFEARSQFTIRKNFTVNDGLPSSRIYDILQDSSSYIWFATENGVSRYDGLSFKNYTTRDGLPDNSTLKLYLDDKGRVWFSSYEGYISYFDKDTIYSHWINDSVSNYAISFFDKMFIDKDDNLHLSPYFGGILKVNSKTGEIELVRRSKKTRPPYWQTVIYEETESGFICASVLQDVFESEKMREVYPNIKAFKIYNDHEYFYQHKNVIRTAPNEYIVSLGRTLNAARKDSIIHTLKFNNDIINTYLDRQGNLWVSERFNGIRMYPGSDISKSPVLFLENHTISSMLQDHEGNYWFCSTENGVYLVPSIQFRNYDNYYLGLNGQVVYKLQHQNNELFFSSSNKGFYKAIIINDSPEMEHDFSIPGYFESEVFNFLISSKGDLMIPCAENIRYDLRGNPIPFDLKFGRSAYSILERKNGKIIMGLNKGFTVSDFSGQIQHSRNLGYDMKTLALCEAPDSSLLLGTIKGLILYKDDEFSRFNDTSVVLNSRITCLTTHANQIWIGTFDNGVAVVQKDELNFINIHHGLTSNRIKAIFPENDSIFWIGTNKGLNKISMSGSELLNFSIKKYTIVEGLPSNEINDITKIGTTIWLGCDNGLVCFNPETINIPKEKPILMLKEVIVNQDTIRQIHDSNEFPYFQNTFTFLFHTNTFKNPKKVNYAYKLNPLEPDWIETTNTSVRYSNLAHGEYSFDVKTSINDGPVSDVISFPFVIHKHFTETIVFRIFLLILLAGMLGYIIYAIINHYRRREELKRHILLAEQKAVRSQMNPHFIFNSLNSIQNFILDHNAGNANLYLSNFSSLIRRILESANNNFSSLREELDTLKLYLDLEKLRFEDQFDYQISIDSTIRPELVTIPSMILQPFLENAIWHGIMPKNSKGKIDLKIIPANSDKILICIEDNGIGRKDSMEIGMKRRHHKPTGIKNIQERIELLNRLNNSQNSMRIVDMFDQDQKAAGTRVELELEI
ncbi:MAG: two-component regulator propeller domain-containing protein [Bacteroidales bacterium]